MADDLDKKLKSAGMLSIEEQMQPFSKYEIYSGMNNMEYFEKWLESKTKEYTKMRMRYEVGENDKNDELYEWIFAHSAAFQTILMQYKAAKGDFK